MSLRFIFFFKILLNINKTMENKNQKEEIDIYKSLSEGENEEISKPISPEKRKRIVRRTKPPSARTLECLEEGRRIRAENCRKMRAKNDEYLELKKELQAETKLKLEKIKTEIKVNKKSKEDVLPIVKTEYNEKKIRKEAIEKARKDLEDELTRKITKKLRKNYVRSKYVSDDDSSESDEEPVKAKNDVKKRKSEPTEPQAQPQPPQKPVYRIVYV